MNRTDIEWCDRTWNPITGCFHECEYCYARGITKRFGGSDWEVTGYEGECYDCRSTEATGEIHELYEPLERVTKKGDIVQASYPFYFDPTFHRYRLSEPQKEKAPQNVFVGSMSDVFGDWVSDEWINAVVEACEAAPWHRYLFLTKNPERYGDVYSLPVQNNYWYGQTWVGHQTSLTDWSSMYNTFLSIEPLLNDILPLVAIERKWFKWVIIGAETGSRKDKVVPKCEWVETIVTQCREANVPVFMKNSLAGVWGEPLIQEYPKGLSHNENRPNRRRRA